MQHHRNYPYGNTGATHGHPISLPPGGTYNIPNQHNMHGHQQGTEQYYGLIHSGMNGAEAQQNDRSYQNTLPATQPVNRHQMEHQSSPRIYPSHGPPGSSSVPHGTQPPYHFNDSGDQRSQHAHLQFIPTPSEMVQYTMPGHPPEQNGANHDYGVPRGSLPRPMRISNPSGPRTGSGGSPTATSGERFLCEKCGKTFSRSHDRKRHHETQHLSTPVIHRCRFCEKEFSRSDSLKRHVDNGCDEMP